MGKVVEDIGDSVGGWFDEGGYAGVMTKAEKPKAAPAAAPPVTMQDANVGQAAKNKSRQLAAASRSKSKIIAQPGSTLGY